MSALTVSLVGSTGSIGTQAADVVEANPERFEVVALGARRSLDALVDQAERLRPRVVAIADAERAPDLAARLPHGVEVVAGSDGLRAVAEIADVVVNGVVGFAGLPVTLAALEAGKRLALANKESLIAAAPVVQAARRTPRAQIVPVDSEHCAIHQCLGALVGRTGEGSEQDAPQRGDAALVPAGPSGPPTPPTSVSRLLVTASGGPFRGRTRSELSAVGVSDALAHPTWQMGPKITIDSSTLMNKGLEVIEAHELFGVGYDAIDVVVHPQSIVHSMVELVDGSTLAQLSLPDMRLPIGYAMGWPDRLPMAFGAMEWSSARTLTFEPPDRTVFTCLDLAYRAGRQGGAAPAWLNAANEIAVEAFLAGRLDWLGIAEVVSATLDNVTDEPMRSVEDVLEADRCARARARSVVQQRSAAA